MKDLLPKAPTITNLARLDDKLVALQIGTILLSLETINLSITGIHITGSSRV